MNEHDQQAAGAVNITEADAEIARLQRELDHFTKSGIIEIAVRNPNVSSYMDHWEGRALAAEAKLAAGGKTVKACRAMPEGFSRQEIEEMLAIVQDEEQTVDGGGEFGPQESTAGWYTRLLRVILKTEVDDHACCPICLGQFEDADLCATDIEMGTCHAACLEGSPVVELETGEPIDGVADTFRYDEDLTTSYTETDKEKVRNAEAVAWRCKDFAGGWILFHSQREAEEYREETGCLMQALISAEIDARVTLCTTSTEAGHAD